MIDIARLIKILAIAELFCMGWDAAWKHAEMSNLYTQMATFAIVDILTIWVISRNPVKYLTKAIQVILWISVLAHVLGAWCWVYDTHLSVYDASKNWIFYLELMAFTAYGTFSGGKRLYFPSGMDDMAGGSSDNSDSQAIQARGGK